MMEFNWVSEHSIIIDEADFNEMMQDIKRGKKNYNDPMGEDLDDMLYDVVTSWVTRLEDTDYYTITESVIKQIANELKKRIKGS